VARYKTSENKLTPLKHYSQQNYMEVEDLVWLSLYMKDNEYLQHPSCPLAPAWAALNSQHLIVLATSSTNSLSVIIFLNAICLNLPERLCFLEMIKKIIIESIIGFR
jgi:hypothetical protein